MKTLLTIFALLICSCHLLPAQQFVITEAEPHYFFLVPRSFANQTEVGGEIAKHNHFVYPESDLRVETVYLPEHIVAFQIQPFASHSAARAYYDHLQTTEADLIAEELTERYFIISRSNLQRVLRMGTIRSFLHFFEETYY